jgi:hypothetical protein
VDGITPISTANIIVENISGVQVTGSPFTSDLNGYSRWIKIIEYIRIGSSTKIFHTPHNITANHPEYYDDYAKPEPNIGSSMMVQVNLTMIRRDLTTNPENITFSPSGLPVAFENLSVLAKIHNIEIDDAFNVRIIIEDDAPEGIIELRNISFGVIFGNSNDDTNKMWKPSPGIHTINVYIDPFNDITETEEGNNDVSIPLNVNARPWVNITEPKGNDVVNGTVNINGRAFDDPRDDTWDITNNISRVDIRLEGYSWIQLTNFPFLIPDFPTGYWNWQYDWDTTEWDSVPISDGNYTLQARAWDGYHYSFLYNVSITVNNTGSNEPPEAIISEPPNNSFWSVNETITFNGTLSSDPDNDPLIYIWDFDDGNSSTGNITTYSFAQKGTYVVSLTVNDTQEQDIAYVTVNVDNSPPYAEVTASTDTGFVNETITFYGYNSTDGESLNGVRLFWEFENKNDNNGAQMIWTLYPHGQLRMQPMFIPMPMST